MIGIDAASCWGLTLTREIRHIDKNNFAPPAGQLGSVGRNTLRADNYFNTEVQIVKPPQDAAGTQRTIKTGLSLRTCGVLRRFDVPILVTRLY